MRHSRVERCAGEPCPTSRSCWARGSAISPASCKDAVSIPYGDLPHWPASKVIGHEGRLVIGTLAGKRVAALAGRAHFYEGHDLRTVTFATRVMAGSASRC